MTETFLKEEIAKKRRVQGPLQIHVSRVGTSLSWSLHLHLRISLGSEKDGKIRCEKGQSRKLFIWTLKLAFEQTNLSGKRHVDNFRV